MKKILILTLMFVTSLSYASNYKRYFQDARFPGQKMIESQSFANLAAASSTAVISATAGNISASAVTLSAGFTNPDYPRNIVIGPYGSTGDVASCDIVVSGTNYLDQSISETFHIAADSAVEKNGSKAFKTVTSVLFPAGCEDAPYQATWNIGVGESVGVSRCLDNKGDLLRSLLNGSKEATDPTMAVDASVIESNTADFNGTMDGVSDFQIYFMQNYRCTP